MTEKNYYAFFDKPTPQNLEANQRGRLTLEQQSAFEQAAKSQRFMVMFWGVMILAVVGFVVFFFWQVAGGDGLLSSPSVIAMGLVAIGVVLLIQVVSGGDLFYIFPRDDIENGQVESVIGKVIWTGRRYRMVSDSRKLKSLRHGRTLPPPGDYRFYCLPESGLVLMAEELGLMSASQPKDLLLDALARANHFSMEDLEANRTGSLSGRQEVRLFGLVSFWVALLAAFLLISIFAVQRQTMGGNTLVYLLLGIMAVIAFVRIGWRSVSLIWDIWGAKADHMDGRVTRHIHHARNTRYYTYQLSGMKFRVSMSAYNALLEGREYRVYFAPRSKRLVAIEPT